MSEDKICMISPNIPPHYSGGGKRALHQAKQLANMGWKVVFITTTVGHNCFSNLIMITLKLPFRYETTGLKATILKNLYHPIVFFKMWQAIKKSKVKLIHCIPAFSWPAFWAVLSARLQGVKVVIETTLVDADDPVAIRKSKLGTLKNSIFGMADAVVNISPLLEKRSLDADLAKNKLHLIPNGIDTVKFAPPSVGSKEMFRRKLGLSKFEYVLISVGAMRPRKCISEIITSFKAVTKEFKDCALVLIGPTDKDEENENYYQQLLKQIDFVGLTDKVIFTGAVDNVEEWLKAGDVFLFASKREGLPNAVLEAAAAGLPVVAMRIPQVTDYIFGEENNSGIVVDDLDGLSNAALELLRDSEHYKRISINARQRILNLFSNEIVMEQYTQLYRELLES